MSKIVIVTDSISDLRVDEMNEMGIRFLPVKIDIDGKVYKDKIEINEKEFYNIIETSKVMPKTSQPSPAEFAAVFEEVVAEGNEVICITASSKLSGTCNSANIAKDMVDENKISVIDSSMIAIAENLLVLEIYDMVQNGKTREEILAIVEDMKKNVKCVVALENMEMLKRGGRIPSSLATLGGMLNIKPVLNIEDGELGVQSKVRGKKAAMKEIVESAKSNLDTSKRVIVGHSSNEEGAMELIKKLEESLGSIDVLIREFGPAIGSHIGTGAVGVAFFQK